MNFNELYRSDSELDYTHYIVGSDQVWNYGNPFSVEPYFLTFENNAVKISYAASIGHSNIPDSIAGKYKLWLEGFKAISVRERQGEEMIRKITGRNDVQTVLDPTFLLTRQEWINGLSIRKPLVDGNYLLVYLLSHSNASVKIAKKIARYYGYKVVGIASSLRRYENLKGVNYFLGNDQNDFVNLFSYAKFVVTNSFHGTAFSVNFNIPFLSTPRKDKRTNSRFVNLLDKVSLTERLIFDDDAFDVRNLKEIGFEHVNDVITAERERSLNFLINAIEC